MKRHHPEPQGDDVPSSKKQNVANTTFMKWQAELDKNMRQFPGWTVRYKERGSKENCSY